MLKSKKIQYEKGPNKQTNQMIPPNHRFKIGSKCIYFLNKSTTKWCVFQQDLRLKVIICFLQIFACKNIKMMY